MLTKDSHHQTTAKNRQREVLYEKPRKVSELG